MKNNKKMFWAVISMLIFMAVFSGCERNSKPDSDSQSGNEEFVWAPEYVQLALNCDYIDYIASAGDTVFINADTHNENEGNISSLYKYNLLDNKADLLPLELNANDNIRGIAVKQDGSLVLIINQYEYQMDENGEITDSKLSIEVRNISASDGTVIDSKDITELLGENEYLYIQHMCMDAQDNLYLYDGDSTIYIFDKDLQKLCDIATDGWIYHMAASKEGDVYITSYGNGLEFRKVDLAGKKLGERVDDIDGANIGGEFFTGISNSFLLSGNNAVSTIDISTGTVEELFCWLDVDIDSDNIAWAGELSDGRIWVITREYNTQGKASFELVYIGQKNASEITAKEEITYSALWLDYNLRKRIIEFNKTNDKYRIIVNEYADDDMEAGITQFNADLATGNTSDLIDLSALDFNQYASKGILDDLYPFMEQSGINKDDYLENILKAYEIDGKLYGITPQFTVSTTLVKSSLVGDREGWTLSEMLDFVEENNPENIFEYGSRTSIFYYCIFNNIDEFINWETGECFFDSEEFIRALEFASQYPEEARYDEEREGISSLLRQNKVLLLQSGLSSVQEYQMLNGLFGEKVAYIGYPNSERNGNLIHPTMGSIGISSKSQHKDGAWEFIKSIISEEVQDGLVSDSWGFPIKKSALDKMFEKDMEAEYYEDENGNMVEQVKTSWGYEDFNIDIMAATQEEVDGVKMLITSAQKLYGNADNQLVNIITEEAEPFFKGQKSAADTAGIIQNRIQIYVNENR